MKAKTKTQERPAYHLTEDQQYALFQARHLLGLLADLAGGSSKFVDTRSEHLCVGLGVVNNLMDQSGLGFIAPPH